MSIDQETKMVAIQQKDEKRVLIETFRWSEAVPNAERCDDDGDFPVLLRATAPRRGIDLVFIAHVKDVDDEALKGKMKKAMESMVDCLCANDCVSMKGSGSVFTPLVEKASGNIEIERNINNLMIGEYPSVEDQLEKAREEVFNGRSEERSTGRLPLIAVLSADHCPEPEKEKPSEFTVRIYPLNKDKPIRIINKDQNDDGRSVDDKETPVPDTTMEKRAKAMLEEAMAPVAATDVTIDMKTFGGVAISSIIMPDGPPGKGEIIHVGSLRAGKETKMFIVNLTVPKEMRGTKWGLMEVRGCYRDAEVTGGEGGGGAGEVSIEPSLVSVLRTKFCPPVCMDAWRAYFKNDHPAERN